MDNLKTITTEMDQLGIKLSQNQQELIQRYAGLLSRWNKKINLVSDSERLFQRHILDALVLSTLPQTPKPQKVMDMGSGAGLPGVIVSIFQPSWAVYSVDTVAKKITFQQVVKTSLSLDNFFPLCENLNHLAKTEREQGAYDLLLARAFTSLAVLLELALVFLKPGGTLWAMKGEKLGAEERSLPQGLLDGFNQSHYPYSLTSGNGIVGIYQKR